MLVSTLDFHSQAAKWFYTAHQTAQLPINLSLEIIDLCLYILKACSMCTPQNYLLLSPCTASTSFSNTGHPESLLPDPAGEHKSINFLVPLLSLPGGNDIDDALRILRSCNMACFPVTYSDSLKETRLQIISNTGIIMAEMISDLREACYLIF